MTLVVSVMFALSFSAHAQSISLESSKTTYKPGESFLVEAIINTGGAAINTVTGTIKIPPTFTVSDIRSGNSVITIWITNPHPDAHNTISFAGGTPGGYSGSHGNLLSFVLTAKQEGTFSLTQENTKILLNDGKGTETTSTAKALALSITALGSTSTTQTNFQPTADTISPEHFQPIITQDKSVIDNQFFASFFAIDKDSGIAHYEVQEVPLFLPWLKTSSTTAASPYILTNQVMPEKVIIRAYDRAGNYSEATVIKPAGKMFYVLLAGTLFIILLICLFFTRRRKKL